MAPLMSKKFQSGTPFVVTVLLKNLLAAAVSQRFDSIRSGVFLSRSATR
jgi:hypothetical protein